MSELGPDRYYPLPVVCQNCWHRWEGRFPKGKTVADSKVKCPNCECSGEPVCDFNKLTGSDPSSSMLPRPYVSQK